MRRGAAVAVFGVAVAGSFALVAGGPGPGVSGPGVSGAAAAASSPTAPVVRTALLDAPGGPLPVTLTLPARAGAHHRVAAAIVIGDADRFLDGKARERYGLVALAGERGLSGDVGAVIDWLKGQPEIAASEPGFPRVAVLATGPAGATALDDAGRDRRIDALVVADTPVVDRAAVDKVQAPVLFVQAEQGSFLLNDADATFAAVSGTAKAVTWTSTPSDASGPVQPQVRAWLNRWVQRDESVALGSQFNWWDPERQAWRSSPSYPIRTRRTVASGTRVDRDLDVVGVPFLRLPPDVPSGSVVKVRDEAPDGSAADLGAARPSVSGGLPELPGLVHRLDRGHRVRVVRTDAGGRVEEVAGASVVFPVLTTGTSIGGPLAVFGGIGVAVVLLAIAIPAARRVARNRPPIPNA